MNHFQSFLGEGHHAPHVAALFGGRTRYEGEGPEFDQPLYVLAFTNRTGSNLLAEHLRTSLGITGLHEALNHPSVAKRAGLDGVRSFPDYLRALVARERAKGDGPFGLKASWDQLAMLLRWRVDRMFPGLRVVHIHRADLVGQAISYHIALQTNAWTSKHRPQPGVVARYDFDRIANVLYGFTVANAAIELTVQARDLPYARVTYEQVARTPARTLARLAAWSNLPLGPVAPAPRLRKQADSESDAMRARFLAEWAERGGIPPGAPAPA